MDGHRGSCPDHTKLSVQFQPWNCWELCWAITFHTITIGDADGWCWNWSDVINPSSSSSTSPGWLVGIIISIAHKTQAKFCFWVIWGILKILCNAPYVFQSALCFSNRFKAFKYVFGFLCSMLHPGSALWETQTPMLSSPWEVPSPPKSKEQLRPKFFFASVTSKRKACRI